MQYIDYYKILGVSKDAKKSEIKKAYKKLARKYHPDLNPGDKSAEEKFKQINEAYEVLGNDENRKKYDRYGKDWQHAEEFEKARQNAYSGGTHHRHYSYSGFDEHDFSDFFEAMFGGGRRASSQSKARFKGADYQAELDLNLTDVLRSHKKTLTVNDKKIRISIPAGVSDGQVIRIKGHGAPGVNGGQAGDLYIRFNIHNNTSFRREGNDLYLQHTMDLYTAVLGGEIIINTLHGMVKVKVKPGTQNGTKIKIKGKGMPVYKESGTYGDLYVIYQVEIPKNLTEKERELFQQLAKLHKNGKA